MSNAEGCAAIANAGFTALVTQASLSLINNEGDLGAVFDDISSSDALRSMLTSMATAGTLSAIGGSLASATGLTDGSLAANVANIASEGVISASIDTAINGGSFGDNLTTATLSAAASTINAEFSKKIGQAANNGNINTALQYAAHAVLGCGTAELAGGNCAAGAVGQVTGEAAAQLYSQVTYDELTNDFAKIKESETLSLAEQTQQINQMIDKWVEQGVNIAKIAGALSSLAVAENEQDVNLAAANGQSAAEHNAFCGGVCIAAGLAIAYASTKVTVATIEEGGDVIAGIRRIGEGEDFIGQLVDNGIALGIEGAYAIAPDATSATLATLEATGDLINASFVYVDDATGQFISTKWNELSPETQALIKGGANIGSIVLPAASAGKLASNGSKFTKLPENQAKLMPAIQFFYDSSTYTQNRHIKTP